MKMKQMLTCLRSQEKLMLFTTFLILFTCATSLAQERKVTGIVKSTEDNSPMPGVNVLVKGTPTGTITDINGSFSLVVPGNNAGLVFSFIGFNSQEVLVADKLTFSIMMAPASQQLAEVVVTALGVERNTKALQSAVSKVSGSSLTQARELNFGASIQGKVAGVNVTKAGTGPAGSSRVIIRGNKSLGGNNQPLYVVDGIPMDNTVGAQAGMWGGADQGDGLSSISPDDIESITVLKGANAAALYGSRGGYGVINITTKKGAARKGIGIEFNSNFVFEKVINYLDLQNQYGAGDLAYSDPLDPNSLRVGSKPTTQVQAFNNEAAWGAKLDGQPNIMWDGVTRPYSLVGNRHNFNAFFKTGTSFTNTIAISGGSDKQTFRFSYSDLKSSAIIPNSGFNRKNLSMSTNGKFGNKITFGAKVLYSNEDAKNRPSVSDSPGNAVQSVMLMAPNYDINDMKGDPNKLGAVPEGVVPVNGAQVGYELPKSANIYAQNPWWAAYQYVNSSQRDRVLASGNIRFDITSFLYLQGRVGMDWYNTKSQSLTPQGTGYEPGGDTKQGTNEVREINQEWTLGFDKGFGKFNVNAFVGGNKMTSKNQQVAALSSTFNIPFFTSVKNSSNQSFEYGYGAYGINSLFASAEVSYGGYLYLTGTARNDWFSVLNPKSNSQLYPSVGASFVFTDAIKTLPEVISFGKIRAAWGQVATANVDPYKGNLTYTLSGQGHLGHPLAAFSSGDNIPNPNLVPALSTETEIGAEMRFMENRLGFDITYYNQKTTDDILKATISIGSGFGSTSMNIGQLSNKGIEIQLSGTPVKGDFTWDVSLNLARNKNKVIALNPGINELIMDQPRTETVYVKNIVGKPFGVLTGWVQKRDAEGNRLYTATGEVVQSDNYEFLGNGVADLTGGLTNSFTFKHFNLSFLIDFKAGGDIYSGTNVVLLESGLTKETLNGREGDLKITGVFENGTNADGSTAYTGVETRTLTAEQAENYWYSVGERDEAHFVYDASFLKLRQITFGYDIPSSILGKTPIRTLTLSFVARNLAILYKNTPNIDPESSYSSSSSQGLDYFGVPSSRTFGFNLRATF
jgi:TonB-linked SusC/RagA family outer membrane protein